MLTITWVMNAPTDNTPKGLVFFNAWEGGGVKVGGVWKFFEFWGGVRKFLPLFGGVWKNMRIFGGVWKIRRNWGGVWKLSASYCKKIS